jgi:hypothetical protein
VNFAEIGAQLRRGVRVTLEQVARDVIAVSWLKSYWGSRWQGVKGAFAELFWQAGQEAADVNLPARCPNDALDAVGATVNIERLPDETNPIYRNRLLDPFGTWGASGTADGIVAQLEAWRLGEVTVWDRGYGWVDSNVDSFNRFWVVDTDPPVEWSYDALDPGDVLDEDDVLGVEGMTQTEYFALRRLVLKWRSAHARPVYLFLEWQDGAVLVPDDILATTDVLGEEFTALPLTADMLSDDDVLGEYDVLAYYYQDRDPG